MSLTDMPNIAADIFTDTSGTAYPNVSSTISLVPFEKVDSFWGEKRENMGVFHKSFYCSFTLHFFINLLTCFDFCSREFPTKTVHCYNGITCHR